MINFLHFSPAAVTKIIQLFNQSWTETNSWPRPKSQPEKLFKHNGNSAESFPQSNCQWRKLSPAEK